MKNLITILLLILSLNVPAQYRKTMLNGWSNPTSPQSAGGDEIFRRDAASATGWEWFNGSVWADMAYFDDAVHADGIGEINNSSTTQTIEGKVFRNTSAGTNGGHCLRMSNVSNKTIQFNLFEEGVGLAIYLYGSSNDVAIKQNFVTNVKRGFLIEDCDEGSIKVHANQFLNMIWDRTAGGIRGQFIQVAITTAAPNVELTSNRGENYFGESENEDLINIYGSGGTSGDPFLVKGNIFRGGAWSTSGGGILAGDIGGQYVDFDSNYLVNPGRYGFQNAGGDQFNFTNNKLYAETLPWNVVGFYMAAGCTNTTLGTTNESNYKDHTGANVDFPGWAGCGGAVSPTINTSMTPAIMNVPDHLLTYMSEDDIYYLRSLKVLYTQLVSSGDTYPSESSADVNVRRPAAVVGVSGSGSSRTLSMTSSSAGTGGSGTNTLDATGYEYVVVSGPNNPTITSPTASSTTVTGLTNGDYVIRCRVRQTNGQFGFKTYHWDWAEFTASGL